MQLSIREATPEDRQKLANLIHFEVYVHRHLDWRTALEWLGHQPYLVAEHEQEIIGTLACPPDKPEIAWVRLFAAKSSPMLKEIWQALWEAGKAELDALGHPLAAAIVMQGWFRSLLVESGFRHTDNIVVLLWENTTPLRTPENPALEIHRMLPEHLNGVYQLDKLAFEYEWRNSASALEMAYHQSAVATVVLEGEQVVGYQISTANVAGGHLARLAVHPQARGRGIGYALVYHLLNEMQSRGINHVTVNTQQDNAASLAVYARAGFKQIEEQYQVYQYWVSPPDLVKDAP
jgi:ribosomal-protein-alanine N-acetyltransferase